MSDGVGLDVLLRDPHRRALLRVGDELAVRHLAEQHDLVDGEAEEGEEHERDDQQRPPRHAVAVVVGGEPRPAAVRVEPGARGAARVGCEAVIRFDVADEEALARCGRGDEEERLPRRE